MKIVRDKYNYDLLSFWLVLFCVENDAKKREQNGQKLIDL